MIPNVSLDIQRRACEASAATDYSLYECLNSPPKLNPDRGGILGNFSLDEFFAETPLRASDYGCEGDVSYALNQVRTFPLMKSHFLSGGDNRRFLPVKGWNLPSSWLSDPLF